MVRSSSLFVLISIATTSACTVWDPMATDDASTADCPDVISTDAASDSAPADATPTDSGSDATPADARVCTPGEETSPNCLPNGHMVCRADGSGSDCLPRDACGFNAQINTSCSVGVGRCAASGHFVCSGSSVVCDAVAGTPIAEVCSNGLDDNCDGHTDETPCTGGTVTADDYQVTASTDASEPAVSIRLDQWVESAANGERVPGSCIQNVLDPGRIGPLTTDSCHFSIVAGAVPEFQGTFTFAAPSATRRQTVMYSCYVDGSPTFLRYGPFEIRKNGTLCAFDLVDNGVGGCNIRPRCP